MSFCLLILLPSCIKSISFFAGVPKPTSRMNHKPEELCNDKHVIVVLCVDDHLGLAEGGDVRVRSVLDGRICNNSKLKVTRDKREEFTIIFCTIMDTVPTDIYIILNGTVKK